MAAGPRYASLPACRFGSGQDQSGRQILRHDSVRRRDGTLEAMRTQVHSAHFPKPFFSASYGRSKYRRASLRESKASLRFSTR